MNLSELELRHDFYNLPECQTQALSEGRIMVTPTDKEAQARVQNVIQHLHTLGAEVWEDRLKLLGIIEALTARIAELEARQVKEEVTV